MCQNERNALAKRMWGRRKITRKMIADHMRDRALRQRFMEDSVKLMRNATLPEHVGAVVLALYDLSVIKLNRAAFNEMRSQYNLDRDSFLPGWMAPTSAHHAEQLSLLN